LEGIVGFSVALVFVLPLFLNRDEAVDGGGGGGSTFFLGNTKLPRNLFQYQWTIQSLDDQQQQNVLLQPPNMAAIGKNKRNVTCERG
jgi:hypothetical protein